MRIDSITLYNFGSYEGNINFDTRTDDHKNIILVGGKNGAGKTTLFTAMRVCLYGYMSMGYKSQNAYYTKAITKLINNKAKLTKPTMASVKMQISISEGRDLNQYTLIRSWILDANLTEDFKVQKNCNELNDDETADFEKYLLSLIPPELFNLYFFDGEKIADFFMNEGGNTRIKDAFLTLCGYDVFDIMRKNFKRVSGGNAKTEKTLEKYCSAKENLESENEEYNRLLKKSADYSEEIETCDAEIKAADKAYAQSGGISQEEWNEKIVNIREEEKKRDVWNAVLKKWANEVVPFLMVRDQISELKEQINKENSQTKFQHFNEVIALPELRSIIGDSYDQIQEIAFQKFGSTEKPILDLSFEQCVNLLGQINGILDFDKRKISKYQKAIKSSIKKSAQLREELDQSNISSVQEYMKKKAELFEKKSDLLNSQKQVEQEIVQKKMLVEIAATGMKKAQDELEEELKKESINDISVKAIVMLDKLQDILYQQQISKIENNFRKEIRTLMRKTNFIDDIKIDNDFNIYLYRHEKVDKKTLMDAISSNSDGQLKTVLGDDAVEQLRTLSQGQSQEKMLEFCKKSKTQYIELPIRIDQTSLSNGEKQIFIMALYHSLVQLGRHEIPFIIDTPFARIDTEHRRNISEHFFSKLSGQVFILSTNEEINSEHVQILKDKIAATYILENTDNKKTYVLQNAYFEV